MDIVDCVVESIKKFEYLLDGYLADILAVSPIIAVQKRAIKNCEYIFVAWLMLFVLVIIQILSDLFDDDFCIFCFLIEIK